MAIILLLHRFLFREKVSRSQHLLAIPFVFVALIAALLATTGLAFAPVLLIHAAISLVMILRAREWGLYASILGQLLLTGVFWNHGIGEHLVLALSAEAGCIASYAMVFALSKEIDVELSHESRDLAHLCEEQTLWKGRFQTANSKIERERDEKETLKEEMEERSEEYYASLESMKELLTLSHRENQKVFEQNQRLMDEASDHLQQIAYLESNNREDEWKESVEQLQAEVNRLRVELYQNQLLYDHYKSEGQLAPEARIDLSAQELEPTPEPDILNEDSIPSEEVIETPSSEELESSVIEKAVEERIEKQTVSENIYLNF